MNNRPEYSPHRWSHALAAPRGLRIRDAANYMGVTPWYVEVIIRFGGLTALKLGRHYTILREDLDTFLDRKRKEARNNDLG